MGKKYLDTKGGTLESSILDVWKQAAIVTETNKNNKSDDGEGLDAVQPKAVKKKFKDRKDKDIDNDGDVDSSDEYLHKRRKAVSKAVASEARQLKDKKKEMMIKHKKTGVKVIDKSDWPVYKKKGYFQVEEVELDEAKIAKKVPAKGGGHFIVLHRDTKGMGGKQDSFLMRTLKKGKVTEYGTHVSVDRALKFAKNRGIIEDVELDEGKMSQIDQMMKDGKSAKEIAKALKMDVKAVKKVMGEEVADQYTEASYFTVQSMRDRLHQVWGEAKEEFPDHKDDEKKIKGKKSKTDTGKDAAVVDVKPEIKERKK